jgi:hypothetical protein
MEARASAGAGGRTMAAVCGRCEKTPLDEAGRCVTCEAEAEGLKLLIRQYFAPVREMMTLLEEQGLSPEMEKVPPSRPEEKAQPLWNLYAPEAEVERAVEFLRADWAHLLEDPDALAAARRGQAGIDLEAGGEVDCPACGHRFVLGAGAECPECGLSLGIPANAAPDEAKS